MSECTQTFVKCQAKVCRLLYNFVGFECCRIREGGDRLMSYDMGNLATGAAVSGPGAILDLIRRGRANTRADLVDMTGLARSTLAQRLDALLAAGLIDPDGEGTST